MINIIVLNETKVIMKICCSIVWSVLFRQKQTKCLDLISDLAIAFTVKAVAVNVILKSCQCH